MNKMVGFFDRLGAYFIDLLIVFLFLSLINASIPNNDEFTKRITELETKMVSGETVTEEIMNEYKSLVYDYQKSSILSSSISIAVYIAYFVIFQYMNNGQTFGKKLLKTKIVSSDGGKVSIFQMFLRYVFIINIFSGIFNILLLFVLSKSNYLITNLIMSGFESIFLIVSGLLILYRKDKMGLHDIMAKTKVIKEV